MGRARILLGELKTIRPGYTFELNAPADVPAVIRVNGKAVGRGELLRIDDRVGVRIIEFMGKPNDRSA